MNKETRICRDCKKELPILDFALVVRNRQLCRTTRCGLCTTAHKTADAKKYRDVRRKTAREHSTKLRKQRVKKGLCTWGSCGQKAAFKRGGLCGAHAAHQSALRKQYCVELKKEVFTQYGSKCSCECGCTESNFGLLTIDHIEGRKKMNHSRSMSGWTLYCWIRKNNYPNSLRLLCYNCNCSRGHLGTCGHLLSPKIESEPILPAFAPLMERFQHVQ